MKRRLQRNYWAWWIYVIASQLVFGQGCKSDTESEMSVTPSLDATMTTQDTGASSDATLAPDAEAIAEIPCNERDEDGDGIVDEATDLDMTCTFAFEQCMLDGVIGCNEQRALTCQPVDERPTAERCNARDDDCDGLVDEDFAVNAPCTNGLGECRIVGQSACKADESGVECTAEIGVPQDEVCNELDDDCDGRIDEGLSLGMLCSDGVGACKSEGVIECVAPGETGCTAVATMPTPEQCNQIDDDCDGLSDEGVCAQLVIEHCSPVILWRTSASAAPLPLSLNECSEIESGYACDSNADEGPARIELSLSPETIPMGYGFALGISCDEMLPEFVSSVFERDCTLWYGWRDRASNGARPSTTLGSCPFERAGASQDGLERCASVNPNQPITGFEFNTTLERGDEFGVMLTCQYLGTDDGNSWLRDKIRSDLGVRLGWAKADAPFLSTVPVEWSQCASADDSQEMTSSCAENRLDGQFEYLQLGSPANFIDNTADVIGLQLFNRVTP